MSRLILALYALAVSACVAAVVLAVAYPIAKCGFWTAFWLGKGAWPAVLMGMCG
ncbi:hypothetical protein D3C87_2061110 [compost metagenome]